MTRSLRPVASLLTGTALLLLGVGLLNTLIPLRGEALGYPAAWIGAFGSAYFAGYFAGTFAITPLVQRIGHIRAFAFCTAAATCVVLLQTLVIGPIAWLALRLAAGMALVGLYTVIESWLNASAQPSRRGAVFAVYMVVTLGALALAQQFLRLPGPPHVTFVVAALAVCAAALPVTWTRLAQPAPAPSPRLQLRRLHALAPSAVAGALLAGLATGAFWGLLPVFARAYGYADGQVAAYMGLAILGGAVLQLPLGRLSDRHDRRVALAWVSAAACLLAVLVPPATAHGQASGRLLVFLFGGALFALYPIVVAHLVDHLPPEDLLAASSSVLLVNGVGAALGPLAAGALMSALGAWALFGWFALVLALNAAYAVHRFRTRHRELPDQAHFQPMLRTTPTVLSLHPDLAPTRPAEESAYRRL